MKLCIKCKKTKELLAFYKDASRKDGLHPYCKGCRSGPYKTSSLRKWRWANPKKVKAQKVRHRKKNKINYLSAAREGNLRNNYGITILEYNTLLLKQGGVCAICGTDKSGKRLFHVDHNHETNKVRGLLCHSCNTGIGLLKDSPLLLAKALLYLAKGEEDGDRVLRR